MGASVRKFPAIESLEDRRLLSGAITGSSYVDLTGDGLHGKREPALPNVMVYLDLNDNQIYDAGDVSAFSNRKGNFKFGKLGKTVYHLRMQLPDGYISTAPPGGAYFVDLRFHHNASKRDFGYWPTSEGPLPVTSPVTQAVDTNPPLPIVMYNTGAKAPNNADGSNPGPLMDDTSGADPYYSVEVASATGPQPFVATYPTFNANRNTSDLNAATAPADSEFISPARGSNDILPAGQYLYATAFDLSGLESATAAISGTVVADDRLLDIRLNGTSLGFFSTAGEPITFGAVRGFVPGVNTLEFLVSNDTDSPSGLRVDNLHGTAKRISAGPITLFNTGVSSANVYDGTNATAMAASSVDPHWLVSTPGDGFNFYTADAAHHFNYNDSLTNGRFGAPYIASDNTKWDNGDLNTASRGIDSTFINPVGKGTAELLPGNYIYRTTFDLTGLDSNTASLDGMVYATSAVDIYLNGAKVGHLDVGTGIHDGMAFHLTSPFVAGINVLDFVLNNGPGNQPTGLRVERLRGNAYGSSIRPTDPLRIALPLPPFIPLESPAGQIPDSSAGDNTDGGRGTS